MSNASKVIIHKLRGEVSLVEQDIVDYVSTAYFEPPQNFAIKNMKKKLQNLIIIGSTFFFSTANLPKISPDLNFCSKKLLTTQLLYTGGPPLIRSMLVQIPLVRILVL